MRNLTLILLLVLITFPAIADNGLSSLSLALERLIIIVVWSIGSLILLIISFIHYKKRKTAGLALLVYLALLSLSTMYTVGFIRFLDVSGSLIFDDTVNTMERDSDIGTYYSLIVSGCILFALIIAFAIYHWKSSKSKKISL